VSAAAHINVYNGTLLDEIIHEQKLSRELVKRAAREIFVIIKEGLVRDGVVRINHFGSFKLKRMASRKGRNPQTGESITIPGHAKVIFSPCKALREMIQPIHPKPIPIPSAEPTQIKKNVKRVAVQSIPELIPEPALLKIESEATTFIEPVSEDDTQGKRKTGGHEKLIYFGIATTIIAVVAMKSMPNRVEILSTSINLPPVAQLQEKPVVGSFTSPVMDVELAAQPESEPEQLQMGSTQSEIQKEESASSTEMVTVTTFDEPTSKIEEVVIEPVETSAHAMTEVLTPAPVVITQIQPVNNFFFTERPYKLQGGNSLWRLSKNFYREPLYWPHIFFANADTINNPDKLREGRTIIMPTLEGEPGSLTFNDREKIAEGYFLVYTFYKESGHADAFFALLEAKRYSAEVVERKRHTLTLSAVENILLDQQKVVANL